MKGWSLYLAVIVLLLCAAAPAGAADYGIPLEDPELAAMAETLHYAMEHNQTNQESTWANPATGHSGTIMPVRSFYSSQGLTCREYFQTLRFDDSLERRLGVACRQPDGVWEVMHEQFLSDAEFQLEDSPDRDLDRDPFDHNYPWVYYDPLDYPYPIYFSFVFVSYRHHFQPRHFHSGHRFNSHQFRDGHRLAPRNPPNRDRRGDPPLVREQPAAPRFERGAAPPSQRPEGSRDRRTPRDRVDLRDQRVQQPEAMPPGVVRVIEEPVRRSGPTRSPASPADPPPTSERVNRGERRDLPPDPPAAAQQDENPNPEKKRDRSSLGREQTRDEGQDRSDEKLRRDERNRNDDHGRRGRESRRAERKERKAEDQEDDRDSRSGYRDRGSR